MVSKHSLSWRLLARTLTEYCAFQVFGHEWFWEISNFSLDSNEVFHMIKWILCFLIFVGTVNAATTLHSTTHWTGWSPLKVYELFYQVNTTDVKCIHVYAVGSVGHWVTIGAIPEMINLFRTECGGDTVSYTKWSLQVLQGLGKICVPSVARGWRHFGYVTYASSLS